MLTHFYLPIYYGRIIMINIITTETYRFIIKNHLKPRLGMYRLPQIITVTIQKSNVRYLCRKRLCKSNIKSLFKIYQVFF